MREESLEERAQEFRDYLKAKFKISDDRWTSNDGIDYDGALIVQEYIESKLTITEDEIDALKEALSSEKSMLMMSDVRKSNVLTEYHVKVAMGLESLLTKLKTLTEK